jgi:hypothetical protein
LLENGYYNISNLGDKKYISVSAGATYNGTGLYLAAFSAKVPQEFAVYFDLKNTNMKLLTFFLKHIAMLFSSN